mmetsp:Transcript_29673/g.68732  ORF Transcript_29673/g.68732 Transcript_29673/m.68732 type:complete len:206 (+) Transcript_29673:445-1062(+)
MQIPIAVWHQQLSRRHCRMRGNLVQFEDGGHAGVRVQKHFLPVSTRLRCENSGELLSVLGPRLTVHLLAGLFFWQAKALEESSVELWFYRTNTNVATVLGPIHIIERCSRVQHVCASFMPSSSLLKVDHERRQVRCAIHHRTVDNLPSSRSLSFEQRHHDAHSTKHATACKICEHIHWEHGPFIFTANQREGSSHREIINIVTSH